MGCCWDNVVLVTVCNICQYQPLVDVCVVYPLSSFYMDALGSEDRAVLL